MTTIKQSKYSILVIQMNGIITTIESLHVAYTKVQLAEYNSLMQHLLDNGHTFTGWLVLGCAEDLHLDTIERHHVVHINSTLKICGIPFKDGRSVRFVNVEG